MFLRYYILYNSLVFNDLVICINLLVKPTNYNSKNFLKEFHVKFDDRTLKILIIKCDFIHDILLFYLIP